MRWLQGVGTGAALLVVLLAGCGSIADDDRLILRFVGFDGDGLEQADQVRPLSADVDVAQNVCSVDRDTGEVTLELVTQTLINVTFINEQAADILLERVDVDAGARSGLGVVRQLISANIPGGRCDSVDRRCALDSDCRVGTGAGNCVHTPTRISSIILFDILAKAAVNPEIYGEATNVAMTFFGSDDTGHSFRVRTSYVVTFADFDNCDTTGGGAGQS